MESEPDEGGWVKRTEEVHLDSSVGGPSGHDGGDMDAEGHVKAKNRLLEQYNELLGELHSPSSSHCSVFHVPSRLTGHQLI